MTAKTDTPPPADAPPPRPRSPRLERTARIALLVLCLLAGLAVGVVGALLHRAQIGGYNGSGGFPDGLLLSLGGLIGLLLGLGEFTRPAPPPHAPYPGRLAALGSAAAGWVIAVIWLTYVGPPPAFQAKGDVVLANDWISTTYLIAGMATATAFVYRAWMVTLNAKMAAVRGNRP